MGGILRHRFCKFGAGRENEPGRRTHGPCRAAITGRVPEYGLHLDENRKGTCLFKVEVHP